MQQDEAKAHMENDNPEFWAELQAKGLNVVLVTQPVNSPDTNLVGFGLFHEVQSANDEVGGGEGEIIEHVKQAYTSYPRQLINLTWLTFVENLQFSFYLDLHSPEIYNSLGPFACLS